MANTESVTAQMTELLNEVNESIEQSAERNIQLVAKEASKRLGIPFGIIDLSLAPTPAVGDSVADILKEIGLEHPGAPGTTAALALLNDQVKKGGVMASSYVGGLSGAFIPVSEDQGMIDAVNAGALTLEKLEAMTPEEREKYLADETQGARDALKILGMAQAMLGDSPYSRL
mgnify:CR=1 FL=1